MRFRQTRSLQGHTIRSATLARQGRRWFISLLVEDGRQAPEMHRSPDAAVGADRGVAVALATSDADLVDRPFVTVGERWRVVALQRKLSRAAKGSANRDKTCAALAEMRSRERRRRLDFCAQTAHHLAAENSVVVLEDLKTMHMTRSANGSIDQPGRNVRAKSGLSRPATVVIVWAFVGEQPVFQAINAATDRAPVAPHSSSRSISAAISTMRPSIALR